MNKSSSDSGSPLKKKTKIETLIKHKYPEMALSDVSIERNLQLLKEESLKSKPSHESMKTLMARSYSVRREALLDSKYPSISSYIQDYPALKRCTYVRQKIM